MKAIDFQNRPTIDFSSEVKAATHVALPSEVVGQRKPLLPSELTRYDAPVVPVVAQAQSVVEHETVEEKA